jgi:hypothetical protein
VLGLGLVAEQHEALAARAKTHRTYPVRGLHIKPHPYALAAAHVVIVTCAVPRLP